MADIRAIQIPERTNGSIEHYHSLIPQHLSSSVQRTSPHPEASGSRTRFLRRLKLRGTSHFGFLVAPERGLPPRIETQRWRDRGNGRVCWRAVGCMVSCRGFLVVLGGEMEGSIKGYSAPRLWMAFVAPGQSLLESFALLTLS